MDILCCQLCALVPGTQQLVLWLARAHKIYGDTLLRIWILPLVGFPLNILLYSASEYRSNEMSGLAWGCGIELQFSPVEVHWSFGSGEREHSLFRNVYHKIYMHAPYFALETKLT
jgi:hypothetical protein